VCRGCVVDVEWMGSGSSKAPANESVREEEREQGVSAAWMWDVRCEMWMWMM
jgi:hypothetical protein